VLGCLSILDDEPRNMSDDELEVLSSMARQLMDDVREALKQALSLRLERCVVCQSEVLSICS
jgi:flagellar motor switch protein FliM